MQKIDMQQIVKARNFLIKKNKKKIEGTVPIGSRYTERTQKKIVKKCHIKKKANSESLLYFSILR